MDISNAICTHFMTIFVCLFIERGNVNVAECARVAKPVVSCLAIRIRFVDDVIVLYLFSNSRTPRTSK